LYAYYAIFDIENMGIYISKRERSNYGSKYQVIRPIEEDIDSSDSSDSDDSSSSDDKKESVLVQNKQSVITEQPRSAAQNVITEQPRSAAQIDNVHSASILVGGACNLKNSYSINYSK
jgi:hypothetical protein